MDIAINYFAVVVCAVAAMALGYAWYGPLFGREWSRLMGWSPEHMETMKHKGGMGVNYAIQAVGALVMAYVFAHSLFFANYYMGTAGAAAGLQGAFWNWLGFIVPVTLGIVLWDGKPWKLWAINAGYYLVVLGVMGVILSLWQ